MRQRATKAGPAGGRPGPRRRRPRARRARPRPSCPGKRSGASRRRPQAWPTKKAKVSETMMMARSRTTRHAPTARRREGQERRDRAPQGARGRPHPGGWPPPRARSGRSRCPGAGSRSGAARPGGARSAPRTSPETRPRRTSPRPARSRCGASERARGHARSGRTRRGRRGRPGPRERPPARAAPGRRPAARRGRARRAVPTREARLLAKGDAQTGAMPPYLRSRFWIVGHGAQEVLAAEVGPQDVGDPDLGVRDLPQQEVRDPQLAARADEQVGVGLTGRVEIGRDASPRRRGRDRVRSRARRRSGGAPRR